MTVFWIEAIEWGNGSYPFSTLTLRRNKDPKIIFFDGDAYWQWGHSPLRNNCKNLCWSQLLHDSLEGWHSTVLHQGESVAIHDKHIDFPRVYRLWELALGTEQEAIKEIMSDEYWRPTFT